MPRYLIAKEAEEDLVRIWHYTARNWSIDQAEGLIAQFHDRFLFLANNPFAGIARPEYDSDLRSFVLRNTPFIVLLPPRI